MNNWLEPSLQRGLRPVAAPPDLWARIQAQSAPLPAPRTPWFVWAMAAVVVLLAVGLSIVQRERFPGDEALAIQALGGDTQRLAFHCQNPAQLRAWVRANTGFDLPLRAESSPFVQLIGAQMVDGARRVEIAYRAGNREAVLVLSKADAGSPNVPHNRARGNVSSWVMAGRRFTLASDNPADLQLACKLCHLD
jgi:hypothetical protein